MHKGPGRWPLAALSVPRGDTVTHKPEEEGRETGELEGRLQDRTMLEVTGRLQQHRALRGGECQGMTGADAPEGP